MNDPTLDHRHDGDRNIIDKVRKLLAKAERTDNPNEADAFSRKAAELIAAHRVDPQRLRSASTDGLSTRSFNMGRGVYVRARLSLIKSVATANGCRMVYRSGSGDTIAMVAGFASDLESVGVMYTSLHTQAAARMASVHRHSSGETRRFRRSFLLGFAAEVGRMLIETQHAAEQVAQRDSTSLPVLRARDQQVDEFARLTFGPVTMVRAPGVSSLAGYEAGMSAAAQSDLGRQGMTAPRSLGPAA